jgi:hypothetical protein
MFEAKIFQNCQVVPFSLGSGPATHRGGLGAENADFEERDLREQLAASEPRGNNLKDLKDFYLNATARIWH